MSKSQEESLVISARAPGKLILSGEHSVVYGNSALAMAINRYAETTITEVPGSDIYFEFLNNNLRTKVSLGDLEGLKRVINKRYRKFTSGKYHIKDVLHSPLELIQYAFIYLVENLFLPIKVGLKIQVSTTLPIGCGMGASSAVILSLMHALLSYCSHGINVDKYLYFGKEIENLQHGKSSGLDLFLSFYGGCYFFENGNAVKRNLPNMPFVLVNTGSPNVSTGECVEAVVEQLQDTNVISDFNAVAVAMDLAIQKNELSKIKLCVHENQKLLDHIGVTPKKVSNFIKDVEARGNAAKISGAGAVSGNGAGIVLVVGDQEILDLVKEYQYEILPVQGESNGICIV